MFVALDYHKRPCLESLFVCPSMQLSSCKYVYFIVCLLTYCLGSFICLCRYRHVSAVCEKKEKSFLDVKSLACMIVTFINLLHMGMSSNFLFVQLTQILRVYSLVSFIFHFLKIWLAFSQFLFWCFNIYNVRESQFKYLTYRLLLLFLTAGDGNFLKASCTHLAFAAAGGGGPVLVRELTNRGKFLPNQPTINVHRYDF